MMTLFWIVACGAALYLILTLYLSLLVQQIPRRPVKDTPDWGEIEDIWRSIKSIKEIRGITIELTTLPELENTYDLLKKHSSI